MKRPRRYRQPTGCLPPQIKRDRIDGLAIGQAVQRLQRDHTGHDIGRHTGPTPSTRKQISEHLIGEQLCPMRRQERKNAVRLQKMPRNRLRIQQLTLNIRPTVHTENIAKKHHRQADRHAALFRVS